MQTIHKIDGKHQSPQGTTKGQREENQRANPKRDDAHHDVDRINSVDQANDVERKEGKQSELQQGESSQLCESEAGETCLTQGLDQRKLLIVVAGCLIAITLVTFFTTLYFAQAVFFPLTLAFVLKLIFTPVSRRLSKFWIPEFVSAAIIVGGIFALTIASIAFLAKPAGDWIQSAPGHFETVSWKLRSIRRPIEKVSEAGAQVDKLTDVDGDSKPLPVQVAQPGVVASLVNTTSSVLMGMFLTLVLLFFFLAGGDRLLEKAVGLAPEWRNKRKIVELARDIQQTLSSYLLATTCINIALGTLIGFGMWLVGLPNPILWGVMAAALNFVPYLGALLGGCIVFLVGLVQMDSVADAIWAPTIYFALNALEGYFITPAILGRSISLSPLAIVISMVVWGWIWGVGGVLLAVPILAATKIACDHSNRLRPVGQLLGT